MNFDFICVDFQNDFASFGGANFNKGKSASFIKEKVFPFLKEHDIRASEIISDYRLPRGKSKNESCIPGSWGFQSLLPSTIKKGTPWIKCMHNPLWIRKNIGIPNAILGKEYQSPRKFNKWLKDNVPNNNVVLFGETADCCMLQVASELYFRGYNVYFIYEACDPMNERLDKKDDILYHSSVSIYAKTICFDELLELIKE